jgi:hypothetical protein
MATRKATPKIGSPLTLALRKLGCTYCERCKGFMYPEHTEHVTAFDLHVSRYALVGGYGNVKLVDLQEAA